MTDPQPDLEALAREIVECLVEHDDEPRFIVPILRRDRETMETKLAEAKAERDEARKIVAAVNNSVFGSDGYFTSPSCVEQVEVVKGLRRKLQAAEGRLYRAWGVIANVSGGDWMQQPATWRQAAQHWRDDWHETLDAAQQAEEKP